MSQCRHGNGRIDWDAVHELMPQRPQAQVKSYYTNYLKDRLGIEKTTKRLNNEDVA